MSDDVGPMMQALLKRYGLESLASWLSERIIAVTSPEQIELELYDRPEFISRFPAIRERGRLGLNPLSVDEYLEFEAAARQTARAGGVPISQDQINKLLIGNTSVQEMQSRIELASRAALQSDSKVREELERLYGITSQDIVSYWLDPKETMVALERKFTSGAISGKAIRAGFDQQLSQGQLGFLMNQGMTEDTATESFGQLVESEELFEAFDSTEEDIGTDEQLKLITGDTDVAQKVGQRAQKRVAKFQEGGEFATGRTGISGLGSANR